MTDNSNNNNDEELHDNRNNNEHLSATVVAATSTATTAAAAHHSDEYHSLSYAYKTYLQHDVGEQAHWHDVCQSFRQYATFAMAQWANQQYRLSGLPPDQRALLPASLRPTEEDFHKRAHAFKDAAIRNQFCLDCILRHAGQPHSQEVVGPTTNHATTHASDGNMSKVSSVLKSLARDWSAEGAVERDLAHQPLLEQLLKYVPIPNNRLPNAAPNTPPPRVCVPGAGVGRLALEICAKGYAVQGNEFSLFMLLASDFILNGGIATPSHPLKLSPWLMETRNVHHPMDPMRVIDIPDIDPFATIAHCSSSSSSSNNDGDLTTADFSMAAGEFASIYGSEKEKGQWDAVVACFFLDASPSIVEYLQVIYGMLKPGGYLFNFGPLLWHWSGPAMRPDDKILDDYLDRYAYLDKKYLTSVDLCWEDIREVMINLGFEMVHVETGKRALYTADRHSMMNMDYRCIHFVARKKST